MKKYENFCKALNNLKEIQKEIPPYSTVVQTGMVSLYEICFEQAWKAMKEVLENNGYSQHKRVTADNYQNGLSGKSD